MCPRASTARRCVADVLVGADGANGIVASETGLGAGIVRGVALEANVSYGDLDRDAVEGTAVIELGVVPGGYGWVFPKGDHANVGVGGWGSEGPRLREHLLRLIEKHDIDAAALRDLRGHRLPMRRLGATPARGRVLLVGDAAGLVDPLSGDGIYEAFVSAELAARAILEGDLPAIRDPARGGARPSRKRVLGREASARPKRRGVLLGGTLTRRLRRRRRIAGRRRAAPERGARPRAPAAARARAARDPGAGSGRAVLKTAAAPADACQAWN